MNPELVGRLQAMMAASGGLIGPGSGYRTNAEQAKLYYNYTHGIGGQAKAAPPGRSNHNHGLAMDVTGPDGRTLRRDRHPEAFAWLQANMGKFGLHLAVDGEDWHLEMTDDDGSRGFVQGAQGMGALGFDVSWQEQQKTQEEREDELIGSYMDALVGAEREELVASPAMSAELATPGATEVGTPAAPEVDTTVRPKTDIDAMVPEPQGYENAQAPGGQPGAPTAGPGGQFTGNVPPPGYVPPGSGTDRWRDVAIAALKYTGQDPAMVDLLLMQMKSESGGDPRAVNNWDVNAQRGDPSKGLMQNIGSAFPDRARELANRGIFDGFANIVASIRYTLNRYGSLQKGWKGHGY